MKNKEILIKSSFFVSFSLSIIGALFKTCHWNNANVIMAIGLLASLSFIILAASEVVSSKIITKNEKIMWISALIMTGSIGGLIYIFSGRKRILKIKKSL